MNYYILEQTIGRFPYLFSFLDSPVGADNNLVSSLKGHYFSHTVRGTRMVNIPAGQIRKLNVINNEELSPLKETNDISIDVLTKQVWRPPLSPLHSPSGDSPTQESPLDQWSFCLTLQALLWVWHRSRGHCPCGTCTRLGSKEKAGSHQCDLKLLHFALIVCAKSTLVTFLWTPPNTADAFMMGHCEHQMECL